jgi:hypothetical protein
MPRDFPWPCAGSQDGHKSHYYIRWRKEPRTPFDSRRHEEDRVAYEEWCPGALPGPVERITNVLTELTQAAKELGAAFGGLAVVASKVVEYESGRIDRTVTLEDGREVAVDPQGLPLP